MSQVSSVFPCLETKRLWLRQTTLKDAEAVFAVFGDPKVTEFHNLDTFTNLDQAVEVIRRRERGFKTGRGIRWGIAVKPDNRIIGLCGLGWQQANGAEVGYELASKFWRQGIMGEALSAILEYGFNRGLELAIAQVMLGNIASRKLLEKLGFESQCRLDKHDFWRKHHNLEQFSLMKAKFIPI